MAKQFWKPGNMLYPLPPVMVSCSRENETPNIITVAWAATINTVKPMLSISVRPERYSYDIIKETGEFVVNLTTVDLVFATDYCGVKSGRNIDKYKEMKLTPSVSQVIKAPGIEESPVNIECKVVEIKELGSHHLFIAEVVGVNVEDKYIDEKGKFHLNQVGLIAYSHGEYFALGEHLGKFGYSVQKKDKVGSEDKHKEKSKDISNDINKNISKDKNKDINKEKKRDKNKNKNNNKSNNKSNSNSNNKSNSNNNNNNKNKNKSKDDNKYRNKEKNKDNNIE